MKLRKILVPLDGSSMAESALATAMQLARDSGATLHLLSATAPPVREHPGPVRSEALSAAEAYLDAVRERVKAGGIPVEAAVWYGTPAAVIVAAASRTQSDLIVMTTHGRSGPERDVLGSVTESVLHGTRLPVLVVHPEPAPVRAPAGTAEPASAAR